MSTIYSASTFLGMVNDGYKYTSSYQKRVREANTDVEALEEKLTDLRKSVRNLNSYSSNSTPNEQLKKQLTKLVDTYKEVKESSEDITDKKLSKTLSKMESLLEDNAKTLKKLGVYENTKGELIFDEEKFEDVEQKDIDSLFKGSDSFIRNMFKLTRTLQKQAEEARYNFVNKRFSSQIPFTSESVALATGALDITIDITKCEGMNYTVQNATEESDTTESETVEEESTAEDVMEEEASETESVVAEWITTVQSYLTTFIDNYNTILNSGVNNTYVAKVIEKTQAYKNELSTIGIRIDESSNNMIYTATDSMYSNEFKAAYESLFGDSSSSYGNTLQQYAAKIYTSALDTDSHGITIDMEL